MVIIRKSILSLIIICFSPLWSVEFSVVEDNSNTFIADIDYGEMLFQPNIFKVKNIKFPM